MPPSPPQRIWRRTTVGLATLTLLVIAMTALATVWLRGQSAESARRTADLESSLRELQRNSQEVEARLARLQSPASLLSRLGDAMGPPQRHQVVMVQTSSQPDVMVARQERDGWDE
ncbi:MAG: hypothetical protein ACFB20_10990 [Opitutales bacterium]